MFWRSQLKLTELYAARRVLAIEYIRARPLSMWLKLGAALSLPFALMVALGSARHGIPSARRFVTLLLLALFGGPLLGAVSMLYLFIPQEWRFREKRIDIMSAGRRRPLNYHDIRSCEIVERRLGQCNMRFLRCLGEAASLLGEIALPPKISSESLVDFLRSKSIECRLAA